MAGLNGDAVKTIGLQNGNSSVTAVDPEAAGRRYPTNRELWGRVFTSDDIFHYYSKSLQIQYVECKRIKS